MSTHYESYLKLNEILNAQTPKSVEAGRPAHDEMLFIVVHQTYELWFKQILHELDSVLKVFECEQVDEVHMGSVVSRIERITLIQNLLISQIDVLETMTAMDFLEFRDLLYPASGFQSVQFRVLENRLGLPPKNRLFYGSGSYKDALLPEHKQTVEAAENRRNLFDCVQCWLERTPFLHMSNYDFWAQYQSYIRDNFRHEHEMVMQSPLLNQAERDRNLNTIQGQEVLFDSLLDETKYESLRAQGEVRLSHRAAQAALFIQLYNDQPALQLPSKLLHLLMELDENLTTWRYRHSLMAKRMLGAKVGTGGSSGAQYLKASTEAHKIFDDFFVLTTFLLPKTKRPELPQSVRDILKFKY